MADKIVRIVADTSKYQKGINDARKSVDGFKSAGSAGSKAVTGMVDSFKKMIPALSVATTGLAALKKTINATQTTADTYAVAMQTMKGVTDNFFASLSQGNLSLFVRNLKEAASAAREAARWVDQFGNTKMSYNYVASSYREQIQEQRAIIGSESGASPAQRQAAAEELSRLLKEWRASGEVYGKAALETLKAGISSKSMGLIGADQIDADTIDQIFRIDAQADYAEQRSQLAAKYDEYTEKLKQIESDFQAKMAELGPSTTTNSAGLPVFQDQQYLDTVSRMKAELESAKKALAAEYEKPIVFNALLELDTDEELQQAMSTMQEVYNSQKLIERTAKTINSDIKQMNTDLAKTAQAVKSVESPRESLPRLETPALAAKASPTVAAEPVRDSRTESETRMRQLISDWQKSGETYKELALKSLKEELSEYMGETAGLEKLDVETIDQIIRIESRLEDVDSEHLQSEIAEAKAEVAGLCQQPEVAEVLFKVTAEEDLQGLDAATAAVKSEVAEAKAEVAGLCQQPILGTVQVGITADSMLPDVTAGLNSLTERLNTHQLDEYNRKLAAIAANREKIDSLSSAFTQLGYAMSASGNDALAAAGSIVAMIAQVVPAMTTLFAASSAAGTAEAVAETPTLAGKIAAIATVTAGIISMVSTFKNLQFAEGGIVPGSNFTDGITARVSSGEMVLNAHDQRNLYESIKGGNIGGGGRSYVTGEQLVTVINNYGRRTGRGEILR